MYGNLTEDIMKAMPFNTNVQICIYSYIYLFICLKSSIFFFCIGSVIKREM